MTGRWDAERDASDAAQVLAGIIALLQRAAIDETDVNQLLSMARNGAAAAGRVEAYLRAQRGAGDGEMATVPSRLAPWRDWAPSRGHLFGASAHPRRVNGVPQPRRCGDPGE
ncbi:hypothetical protein ACTI_12530 [Actinoplanes sp. OR16]|uniref:hypothetical protein n=1 Tax=Actinoplanes sp. OR16 TaxID=946334 RepID=UPI000F712C8D|nr:hypothetical protein [Actinoplanes sp. OR16]BBH64568.1 hypothetical protein ACTI_12530 [Actinoplanes sp. OR16]